ncbi:ABC transporter substrate-binding protein [Clostridium polynesiense]|uniref:ABC transporter substrate-binding protein n=1 Tax=Clostridium polynesiense TaxID=1325933 RepID=UPI0006937AEF|nr:ABC transporter substrate-binding protein [Clostridium polynesiense]
MKYRKSIIAFLSLFFILFAAGCSKNTEEKPQQTPALKIGVMPAVDSAPIFLAEEKGYFKELGLDIEVQVYTNAMNRQSALQSNELDGAMTDVIALVNNVENGFDIKVTTSTDGVFPFLINKNYDGDKNVKVGMMEVSVSNYLADRSLVGYNVDKVYINEIPARLEMVGKGSLDMAVIPEPMASKGEMNGLTKLVIENTDKFSPDVMVFTGKAIKEKEESLKLFHKAYNKAVDEINKNDGEAREILVKKLQLAPEIKDKIILPKYNKARVPSEEYLKEIMKWNEEVLGKKVNLKYSELVEGKFVND